MRWKKEHREEFSKNKCISVDAYSKAEENNNDRVVKVFVLFIISFFCFMSKNFAETDLPADKRLPRYAGKWYEQNSTALNHELGKYLESAGLALAEQPIEEGFPGNEPASNNILAAVMPHASYQYSGRTAAFAYEKLKGIKVQRIFLLGPSHYVPIKGGALPDQPIFATPLGDLSVDQEVIKELSHFPHFKIMSEVHVHEHSLEMQLPLIVKTFGHVKLVPIAIGSLSDEGDMRLMGNVLRRFLHDGDLVIVSSDFTHYGPRYEYQPFVENIPQNVRALDEEAFHCLAEPDLSTFCKI